MVAVVDLEDVKDRLRYILNNVEYISPCDMKSGAWVARQVGRLCGTSARFLHWRQYRVLEWSFVEPHLTQVEIGHRLGVTERTVRSERRSALEQIGRRMCAAPSCGASCPSPLMDHEFVYLISSATGLYKIGRSVDVPRRLDDLQRGSPVQLEIVCAVEADNAVETELLYHRRFASKRVRGEWFALNGTDVETIASEMGVMVPPQMRTAT